MTTTYATIWPRFEAGFGGCKMGPISGAPPGQGGERPKLQSEAGQCVGTKPLLSVLAAWVFVNHRGPQCVQTVVVRPPGHSRG